MERISVPFCCNMDSTEKTKLLVIGKSGRLLCLHNVHVPVDWESNKSAWMTKHICNNWLLGFNSGVQKQKNNVLLFEPHATSGASCHKGSISSTRHNIEGAA